MQDRAEDDAGVLPAAVALVTEPPAAAWRRRLGPLAWVALEHLALSSHLSDQGWVAPMGVRDVAAGIGVTKDSLRNRMTPSPERGYGGAANCPEARYKDLAHAQIGCIPNKDGNRPRRGGRRSPDQLHLFDEPKEA